MSGRRVIGIGTGRRGFGFRDDGRIRLATERSGLGRIGIAGAVGECGCAVVGGDIFE